MKTDHISDYDIQQLILDDATCDHSIIQHVRICPDCSRRAERYRLIFATLERQARPTFDFDLTGIVLARIAATKKAHTSTDRLKYWIIAIIAAPIAVASYFLGESLLNMFSGVSAMALYLVATTAATLLAFQIVDMIQKHKKHMSDLELAEHL